MDFLWHGHHFAVKKTLESFEIKDQKLYITAASMLVQATLFRWGRNEIVIDAINDTLNQAIDLMRSDQAQALALTGSVKKTIRSLIGK